VLQSKNPVYFGEPQFLTPCESQVISLAWGGLHVISVQPRNFLVKESLPFILKHPNRSNHYNLEFYTRECTVSSAFHPRPQALPAVHESESTDNSAFPYTEHPPQQVFHFSKCPAAYVFTIHVIVEWIEVPCSLGLCPVLHSGMD